MPFALHSSDIAGAVVVVVKDGKVLVEKGYGFSDVRQAHTRRSQDHPVPARIGFQAAHLDRRNATG